MATATATGSEPTRRQSSSDRRLRGVLLFGGLLLVEVILGAGVASSHSSDVLTLPVAVAAAWCIWRFPIAGILLMLFLAAGIIYPEYFVFHLSGRTVYGNEIVLLVLLARAAINPHQRTWGGAAGGALALFLIILTVSTALAVSSGSETLFNAINWSRGIYVVAAFWVVIRLIRDRHDLAILLTGGLVLGAISGVVGVVLAVSGHLNSIFQDSGNQVLTGTAGSLLRVRMPGLGLGFMLLWLMLAWMVAGRRPRKLWWACLPGVLLVVLVSQNRNMWVAGIVALLLMMLVSGTRMRGRFLAAFAILAAAVVILFAVPASGGGGSSPIQPIVSRASTILNPSEIGQSASAKGREMETQIAWAKARHNLIIGIGPGVPFGMTAVENLGDGLHDEVPQLFLHNQYLYLLLITGIPGLLSFVAFLILIVRSAFGGGVPFESRFLGIGVVALMLTAFVMISLTDPSFLSALALVAGAIFTLNRGTGPTLQGTGTVLA
jgi:O-antigen ligase